MNEHEFEPIPGLPEDLPEGEVILWQGSPDWRVLARRVFRLRVLGGYFALLLAIRSTLFLLNGVALTPAAATLALLATLGAAAAGLFALYAWLIARSTVYTITSRRLVMRFGIALPLTINVPFSRLQSAAVRCLKDGSGDIPVVLDDSHRVSYVVLWPHVRPWKFRHPEPMLRGLHNVMSVADTLADAAVGQASFRSRPERVSRVIAPNEQQQPVGAIALGEMS